jgi:hypothetical protein
MVPKAAIFNTKVTLDIQWEVPPDGLCGSTTRHPLRLAEATFPKWLRRRLFHRMLYPVGSHITSMTLP